MNTNTIRPAALLPTIDGDARITCVCGNTADQEGFPTVDQYGHTFDATSPAWNGTQLCPRCRVIFRVATNHTATRGTNPFTVEAHVIAASDLVRFPRHQVSAYGPPAVAAGTTLRLPRGLVARIGWAESSTWKTYAPSVAMLVRVYRPDGAMVSGATSPLPRNEILSAFNPHPAGTITALSVEYGNSGTAIVTVRGAAIFSLVSAAVI
jgi:hypothetical protein